MPVVDDEYVFQLQSKLQQACPLVNDVENIAGLVRKLGVARTTFDYWVGQERLTVSVQADIAAILGFNIGWTQWRDRKPKRTTDDAQRRDTATRFIRRLKYGAPLKILPGNPDCRDWKFANFRIKGNEDEDVSLPPDALQLFDEIHCICCDVGAGFLVGLKKFDLEFELSERDGVELAAEPERARESVTITPWGVGSQRYFTYAATVPPMQVNLAPIERLAYYLGGQDGDRIGVSMTASLLDETFVDCRGAKLSKPKKQKVAEILAKKHAFGEPDEPGVVKLSQQALFLREEL